jgi:leader peptidase (prepilin peptidase)/N-methyltransferase
MPPDEVLEPFALSPGAYVTVFVLGTLFGSFANVCIYRWPPTDEHPKGRSVVKPGSHCFSCGKPVRWYDNVPLLAYLWLRGACRDCGATFSPRYLLVEAALGILFVAIYHHTMALAYIDEPMSVRSLRFMVGAAFLFVLVVIAFIDLDHKLILDKMTYPSVPLFYGLGMLLPEAQWYQGLIGAAVGYGVIRIISDGYYYLTGREGLGYGDGKLLAIIGALLGWKAVFFSLFAGSLLGSVIGITAIVIVRARGPEPVADDVDSVVEAPSETADAVQEDGEAIPEEDEDDVSLRHVEVPFGPFLAMAAMIYLFTQPWLHVGLRGLWGTNG